MIAGLPMYDRPELFEAHNKFWQLVHKQIVGSPEILSRNMSSWDLWTSPKLFLAQTCSSPYRERLHKITTYVGTADYGLPNCPPGYYNSLRNMTNLQQRSEFLIIPTRPQACHS